MKRIVIAMLAGWDAGLAAGDYVETGFNSNQVSPDITAEREWKR